MNSYFFHVSFYDGYESFEEQGTICGESYMQATENLVNHYGEKDIVEYTFEYITDKPLIIFPNEINHTPYSTIKDALKDNNDF